MYVVTRGKLKNPQKLSAVKQLRHKTESSRQGKKVTYAVVLKVHEQLLPPLVVQAINAAEILKKRTQS